MRQTTAGLLRAPTDLSNFLSCRHLSALDLRAARGEIERPVRRDVFIEDLRARGLAHERAYLERLRAQGLTVAGADDGGGAGDDVGSAGLSAAATLAAMRAGVDVLYQATLEFDAWSGRADFLRKVATPSSLGAWSYEAWDTKLARDTKGGTILQLCVYSYLLERIQGARPARMHVVTPGTDFEPMSYRVDDFGAYFRLLERGIDGFLASHEATYPDLVSHCDYCAWWSACEARRRADDHLCYVAGIGGAQIKALRALGVDKLATLAALDPVPEPPRGSREALTRLRDQARIQQRGRDTGAPVHELKQPFDSDHGLALLPEPTPDDIFLDFEGDHFAEQGVREYLLGYVARGPDGAPRYTPLWARTLAEERAAFERFMDFVAATRARNPGGPRLSLRAVRADGAQAPDGPVRDARGRARRAAARPRIRRPARRRPARADRERRALLDQGPGALLRLRARPGPARGRDEPAHRRGRDRRGRPRRRARGAPADRGGLQPGGLRVRAAAARLARAASLGGPRGRTRAAPTRGRERRGVRGDQRPRPRAAAAPRRIARRRAGGPGRTLPGAAGPVCARTHDGVPPPRGQSRLVGILPAARARGEGARGGAAGADRARVRGGPRREEGAAAALLISGAGGRCAQGRRGVRRARREDRHGRRREPQRAYDRHQEDESDRGRAPDGGLLSQPGVFGSAAQVAHAVGRSGARERVLRRRSVARRHRPLAASPARARRCERPPAAARRDDRAGRLPHRARARRQRARDPGSARARARPTPARTSSARSCARGSRWASRRSATR